MASTDDLEFLISLGMTLDDASIRRTMEAAQASLNRLFQDPKTGKAAEAGGKGWADKAAKSFRDTFGRIFNDPKVGQAAGKAGEAAGKKFTEGISGGAQVSESVVKALTGAFLEAEKRITKDSAAEHLARAAALRNTLYRDLSEIRTHYGKWNTEAKNAQQQRNNESREFQAGTKRDIQTLRTLADFQKATASVAVSANQKGAAAQKRAGDEAKASATKVSAGYKALGEVVRNYAKIHKSSNDVTIADTRKQATEATATAKKVSSTFKFMGEGMKAYATVHASETRRITSATSAQTAAANAASRQAIQASKASVSAAEQASKAKLLAEQQGGNQTLQMMKAQDREEYTDQQASQARRTALFKTGLRLLGSTTEAGLKGIGVVWRWAFRDREKEQQSSDQRMTVQVRNSMRIQQTAVALGLTQINNVYTQGAQKRLLQIEKDAQKETTVVTEAQAKRAAAVKKVQEQTQKGVLGAATGGAGVLGGGMSLSRLAGGLGAGFSLGVVLKGGWDRLKTIEDSTNVLTTILGSQKKAADLMAGILKTVQGTPFTLPEFATAGKNLVAFGVDAKKVPGILTALGDSAAASGKGAEGLTQVADAFGKIAAKGRVQLGDVWSIADSGVDAMNILANGFGVSTDQLQKMIQKGMIPAGEAIDILTKGIEEGTTSAVKGNKSTKAFSGTMEGLAKTVSGSSANAKAALDRMGAAIIGPAFRAAPGVLKKVTKGIDGITGFVKNITEGKGAWKIVRDGLVGIAVGLAAIATAKLGFEIIKLMPALFSALTANPILLGLSLLGGAIYAVVKHTPAIQDFFKALWEGTRGWFLVGYRIKGVVDNLSPMVTIQSTIGAAARKFVDFFKAFRDGTKAWFLVGYRIGHVYDKLTPIVALQTAIGATARAFRDAFGMFTAIIKEKGLSVDAIFEGLGVAGDVIQKRLAPIKAAVLTALGDIGTMVGDFFTGLFTDPLKDVKVSPFDLSAMFGEAKDDESAAKKLGARLQVVIGKAFGTVQRAVTSFFTGLIEGAVKIAPFDFVGKLFQPDTGKENAAARSLGDSIHRIVASVAGAIGRAAVSFYQGLFGKVPQTALTAGEEAIKKCLALSPPAENEVAANIGASVRRILGSVFSAIGTAAGSLLSGLFMLHPAGENKVALSLGKSLRGVFGRIGDIAGSALSGLGDLIVKYVLPAVIDLPRVLGKFLSTTVFSEPFIKGLAGVAAIVGGLAAAIAFQFVRGFLEGLWNRKDDILSAIFDIFKWVAKQFVGGGNPFAGIMAFIGTALLAGFAAIKVGGPIFKAIDELKDNFKVAGVAIKDGIEPAHQKMIDLRKEALQTKVQGKGFGEGIVGAAAGVRRSVDTTVDKVQRGTLAMGNNVVRLQDATVKLGDKFYDVGQQVGPAFGAIGGAVKNAGPPIAGFADMVKQKVGDAFKAMPAAAQQYTQQTSGHVNKMAAAIEVAASAIAGYFAGMSDDGAQMAVSFVGIGTSVVTAFATEGPIVGSITAGAAVVGFVLGRMQKSAKEAKEKAKKDLEETRKITQAQGTAVKQAFDQVGGVGWSDRAEVALRTFQSNLDETGGAAEDVAKRFGLSADDIVKGYGGTKAAAKAYNDEVLNNKADEMLAGNKRTIGTFSKVYRTAALEVTNTMDGWVTSATSTHTAIEGVSTRVATAIRSMDRVKKMSQGLNGEVVWKGVDSKAIREAGDALTDKAIDWDGYIERLRKAGVNQGVLGQLTKDFKTQLETGLAGTAGGKYLSTLNQQVQDGASALLKRRDAEAAVDRIALLNMPPLEQKAALIERTRDAWAAAKDKALAYIEGEQGISTGFASTELAMRGIVTQIGELGAGHDANLQKQVLLNQLTQEGTGIISGYAAKGVTDVNQLKLKYIEWVDTVLLPNMPDKIKGNKKLMGELRDQALNMPDAAFEVEAKGAVDAKKETDDVKKAGKDLDGKTYTQTVVTKMVTEQLAGEMQQKFGLSAAAASTQAGQGVIALSSKRASEGLSKNEEKLLRYLLAKVRSEKYARGELAQGGFITSPMIALIGEAGQELVLPLTDPKRTEELLRQAGLADQLVATAAKVTTGSPVAAATMGSPAAMSAPSGVGGGATAAVMATATVDKDGIAKATTETATAFAPIGKKMTDAAAPGLALLTATTDKNAKAITTDYTDTHKATVAASAVWPQKMRSAALPGLQANQATIQQGNQVVRTDYRNTHVATVASAQGMSSGVQAAGRQMTAGVTTAANTMASNLAGAAKRGSTSAVSSMTSTLKTGATQVGNIVNLYSRALVGALNPVLESVGGKKIPMPPPIKLARGGFIPGSKTTQTDTVPAMLMTGEYVQPRHVVDHYGTDFMEDLRQRRIPRYAAGGLVFPIAGHSTAGQANSWGNPRSGGRSHKGSDLFAPAGTPVVAAKEGVVEKANRVESGLGGITVTVGNGGWNYYYAHLSSIAANIMAGVAVKAGQVLGAVGNTGNARGTPSHLHFSVYPDAGGYNAGVNPWDLLTGSTSVGALANMGAGGGPGFSTPPIPKTPAGWVGDTAKAAMEHTVKAIEPWVQSHVNNFGAASATNFPIDPAIFKNINPNAVLATIRMRESGGNYKSYWKNGPGRVRSSASGAYGMLDSTFQAYGGQGRAMNATPAEQDRVAMNMLNDVIRRYGPNLEAIPATWYEGHYNGPGSLNHRAADGGSVQAYVNKWIEQYQQVLKGQTVRLEDGGLVGAQPAGFMGVPADLSSLAGGVSPMSTVNHGGSSTTNNKSFDAPIIGNVHVHSNASDAEAIAMLLGARLDPIARRAMVGA